MPAINFKPSPKAKKRPWWGDIDAGENLSFLIEQKFGSKHGHVKHVLAYLNIQRRLLDMYKSGERNIPEQIWARLELLHDYTTATPNTWADDFDPLT